MHVRAFKEASIAININDPRYGNKLLVNEYQSILFIRIYYIYIHIRACLNKRTAINCPAPTT